MSTLIVHGIPGSPFGETPNGAELLGGSPLLDWTGRMSARPSVKNTSWDWLLETVAA